MLCWVLDRVRDLRGRKIIGSMRGVSLVVWCGERGIGKGEIEGRTQNREVEKLKIKGARKRI